MVFKRIVGLTTLSYLFALPSYALTLSDTIAATMERNPDILSTEKDFQAISEALIEARAPFLPQVKINFGYGPDKNINSNTIGSNNTSPLMPRREEGVTLNQMLFDGFATKNDVARNRAKVSSATYKVLASVEDNVQRNIEVYIGVLREQELLALAQQNLEFHEKIARMIRMRTLNGISREADAFQAEARLSLAKANVLAEMSNLADAKANFYRTVGLTPDALQAPPQPDKRYVPTSQEEALDIALKNNPVIRSASSDIMAAIEQHNVSTSTNYPRFDLQVGVTRDRNIGGVRGPSFDQYAVVRMTYDLFNGGADFGRQRETAYLAQEAKEIKSHATRQLIESVKLTWDLYTTARAQIPELGIHVRSATRTVKAYAEQYQIGQRTLLDLLDGQNELFGAKRSLISGHYDVLLSEYRILRDMGISIVALHLEQNLAHPAFADAVKQVNYPAEPTELDRTHFGLSITEANSDGVKDKRHALRQFDLTPPVQQPLPPAHPATMSAPTPAPVPARLPPVNPLIHPAPPPPTKPVPIKPAPPQLPPQPLPGPTAVTAALSTKPIQMGCFKSKKNVDKLVAELQAQQYIVTTEIISSPHDGALTHVYAVKAAHPVAVSNRSPVAPVAHKTDPRDELLKALLGRVPVIAKVKGPTIVSPPKNNVAITNATPWKIQVGCFKNSVKAEQFITKLRAAHFTVTTQQRHGLAYVYVGQATQQSALKPLLHDLQQRLQVQGFPVQV